MTVAVISLSGGVGSWAAAKRAQRSYDQIVPLFADTLIEDGDLYRFLVDVEDDLGVPIVRIADGRNPWELFADEKIIGNTRADPCSRVLKRELLRSWITEHYPEGVDVVIGIDWTEEHRTVRIRQNYDPHAVVFPLISDGVDKCDMLLELDEADIARPRLYEMGFAHNNCGGFCVKAGQAQFARLLHHFPERYAWHERQEQALREKWGKDVAVLRDRRGGETTPHTMRDFRHRIERGEAFDVHDWGGCGCATDDGAPSQLVLDLDETPVRVEGLS